MTGIEIDVDINFKYEAAAGFNNYPDKLPKDEEWDIMVFPLLNEKEKYHI